MGKQEKERGGNGRAFCQLFVLQFIHCFRPKTIQHFSHKANWSFSPNHKENNFSNSNRCVECRWTYLDLRYDAVLPERDNTGDGVLEAFSLRYQLLVHVLSTLKRTKCIC